MYLYLYDASLKQRQYERVISNLETQLTDLGIAGKIVRLSSLLSPKQVISEEVRRSKELTTVVIVGDDTAFTKIIQQVADSPVTFGWVPVGPKTDLAERFGLPYGAACAQVLSRRRVINLDVGMCNQFYFLDSCHIPLSTVTMSLGGSVTISGAAEKMECFIWNVPPTDQSIMPPGYTPSPCDRQLEIVLQPVARKGLFSSQLAPPSIFPFTEARLKLEKSVAVEIDGNIVKESQLKIRLLPQALKLIVNKVRLAND
ncbi:MAG: hypothetical protein NT003_00735 [Candidatus Magasanikbacteria bacterium]|nr:hypothetical protein [Candidatus Magasanikbacteria bacterium]